MNTTSKMLAAMAVGAAVGAIAGIMLAPDKGSETRRKLKEQGKRVADNLKDKFNHGKEKMNGMKEDIEQAVKDKAKEFA
ncbi:MAG: YtxH domain-containing protein [Chitinophagaceae bacterium]|nr:YtxH domain-containing protein [Chitinophagaceae bacterium]